MLRFWKVGARGEEVIEEGSDRVMKCVRRDGRRVGRRPNQKWERVVKRAPLCGMPFFRTWAQRELVHYARLEESFNMLERRKSRLTTS